MDQEHDEDRNEAGKTLARDRVLLAPEPDDKRDEALAADAKSCPGKVLELFHRFFMAFPVQIVMVLLTVVDIVFLIYEFSTNKTRFEILTMFTSTGFMFEVLAGLGHLQSNYFLFEKSWVIGEVSVVTTSFVVEYVQFILKIVFFTRFSSWVAYLRAVRFFRVLIVWKTRSKKFATAIRRLVSADRRRLEFGGYDLDLTYVNNRVIAMSWPSDGLEGLYRNNINHVAQYLNERHPDSYMIFNLCSERQYDESKFGYRVHRYKLDDHNPGALSVMVDFALDVDQFLKKSKRNIVVIHCKGGKGRTGTMICTHFLFSGFAETAQAALSHFGSQRTSDFAKSFQGVESPSQERYVRYFGELVKRARDARIPIALPPANKVRITKLVLHFIPIKWWDVSRIWFAVLQNPSDDQRLAVYISNPSVGFVPNVGAVKYKHGKPLQTEHEAEPDAAQCTMAGTVPHIAGLPYSKSVALDPAAAASSNRNIFNETEKMAIPTISELKKASKEILTGEVAANVFSPSADDDLSTGKNGNDDDGGSSTPQLATNSSAAGTSSPPATPISAVGVFDKRVDVEFDCSKIPALTADVVIKFFYDEDMPDTLHCPLQVWFNVNMESDHAKIRWTRPDIDGPHKDPKYKKFPRDFSMSIDLAPAHI